jgi:hypothetical protein
MSDGLSVKKMKLDPAFAMSEARGGTGRRASGGAAPVAPVPFQLAATSLQAPPSNQPTHTLFQTASCFPD